jgi:hypothetical protein
MLVWGEMVIYLDMEVYRVRGERSWRVGRISLKDGMKDGLRLEREMIRTRCY